MTYLNILLNLILKKPVTYILDLKNVSEIHGGSLTLEYRDLTVTISVETFVK